jgi:hypothetical protein
MPDALAQIQQCPCDFWFDLPSPWVA